MGLCRVRDLLSADTLNPLASFAPCPEVLHTALSLDGSIAVVCRPGVEAPLPTNRVEVYEAMSGRFLRSIHSANTNASDRVVLDPSGSLLAYDDAHSIRSDIYSLPQGDLRARHPRFIRALSPHGQWLATRRALDALLSGFTLQETNHLGRSVDLGVDDRCEEPTFSPDGQRIAWGTSQGTVYVCEIEKLFGVLEQRRLIVPSEGRAPRGPPSVLFRKDE